MARRTGRIAPSSSVLSPATPSNFIHARIQFRYGKPCRACRIRANSAHWPLLSDAREHFIHSNVHHWQQQDRPWPETRLFKAPLIRSCKRGGYQQSPCSRPRGEPAQCSQIHRRAKGRRFRRGPAPPRKTALLQARSQRRLESHLNPTVSISVAGWVDAND
jgi:hypothetical protein